MRLFIAGATGVLGKAVIREVEPLGFEVLGLARSDEKASELKALGVEPVLGSLTERGRWMARLKGCDAVLNLATAIPKRDIPKPADWAANDRVRTEGTRNLLTAAKDAGAEIYLQESIALVHGDHGDAWVDEDSPVDPNAVTQSAWEMEKIVDEQIRDHGFQGAILRLGNLYGPGSWHAERTVAQIRGGKHRVVGDGRYYWSLLHVEDAARAFVLCLEERPIGDTILFVDDEPVRYGELSDWTAKQLGARPSKRVPLWLARLAAGRDAVEAFTASLRVRNKRAREQHGWKPAYSTYREGMRTMFPHKTA